MVGFGRNGQELSFDVVLLYTNLPVHETIDKCADLLFRKVILDGVDKETFKVLAELASCNVLISTHAGFYRQVEGLGIGI